jgi:hypothetical protein
MEGADGTEAAGGGGGGMDGACGTTGTTGTCAGAAATLNVTPARIIETLNRCIADLQREQVGLPPTISRL